MPDGPINDVFERALRDVRISVTDRCNFRCTYCMPRSFFGPGHRFLPQAETMTVAEIVRLGTALVRVGVRKIRLTGGEPLLRGDLAEIVRGLADCGVDDLALTTNGSLLSRWAPRLRDAGLHRITVSLDTLDPEVHARISDSGVPLSDVLSGVNAAGAAGFLPVKLNAVIRRGVNEGAIVPLVEFARANGHILRFIEYMDVGESNHWRRSDVVSAAEIRALVSEVHPLEAVKATDPSAVARWYRYRDGQGLLGIIPSVTEPFCGGCTRLRVSADGKLHTCLFSSGGSDVLSALRRGDDGELLRLVTATWTSRTDRYSERRAELSTNVRHLEMSYLGG
jgi:cyclic pyranopterin phosphate synthase